jgi:hypothetical protein
MPPRGTRRPLTQSFALQLVGHASHETKLLRVDAFSNFLGRLFLLTAYRLKLLNPVAHLDLGDIDVTLGVHRQSVSVRKFAQ